MFFVFSFQVLFLVVGRWLAGFLFLKHDLEILDDPIPDKLYCKRFVHHIDQQKATEEGNDLIEREEEAKSDQVRSPPVLKQRDSNFNLTREVDKCDLWKNMVRRLDAPMPSPRRKARHGVSSQSHSFTNAGFDSHAGTSGPEIPSITIGVPNELYRSTAV